MLLSTLQIFLLNTLVKSQPGYCGHSDTARVTEYCTYLSTELHTINVEKSLTIGREKSDKCAYLRIHEAPVLETRRGYHDQRHEWTSERELVAEGFTQVNQRTLPFYPVGEALLGQ